MTPLRLAQDADAIASMRDSGRGTRDSTHGAIGGSVSGGLSPNVTARSFGAWYVVRTGTPISSA